jgi:hypothetical protein
MANRYPIIVDTTNGNQFRELPEGDNLLLTGSSIVNALNISAIGTIEAQRIVIQNTEFTGSYEELSDKPAIPSTILELGILDGSSGQVLTTNGSGIISFQNIPLQDPVVGGDLSGTASTAQIRANTVGVNELDVVEGQSGQVLATDGAGNLQFITMTGGTGGGGGASNFLELSGTIGLNQIQDDFISEIKLKIANNGVEGQYLTINSDGDLEYRALPEAGAVSYNDLTDKPVIPTSLLDLSVADGNADDYLVTDGSGNFSFVELNSIKGLSFSGTTISSTSDNTNVTINAKGTGYLGILGTNAVVIPSGTTAERGTIPAGGIRFNSELNAYEGFDGTYWGSLGGVKDADQDTTITTESSAGADEDTLTFTTGGIESATLSANLLNIAQGVDVKINSTQSALDFDTGALSVDGGVSIRGNLLVSGSIDVDQTFDTSALLQVQTLTDTLTNIVTVTANDISYFKANQYVRLYNASPTELDEDNLPIPPLDQTTTNLSLAVAAVGFGEPDAGDETPFDYRIAQMDITTGKISSATISAIVDLPSAALSGFNNNNNVQLTLSRQSANHAICVYRKVGAEVQHKLIYVLGPKELQANLSNIQWTDYYDFDRVDWAGKDFTNAFTETSGVVHVPLVPPANPVKGWIDTRITSIDLDNNQLELDDSFVSSSASTSIVIDDTINLQASINQAKSQNRNSVELENRTYYVKELNLPSDFTFYGQGDQTQLIKTPWSMNTATASNSVIRLDDDNYTSFKNVSLKNLRIDGNFVNQFLASDIANPYLNYAVHMYGQDILIENVEIQNVIGGGVYSFDPSITQDLTLLNCEITNGTLTYVYEGYGPVFFDECRNVKIAHNTFRGFPGPVSIGAVQKGIVSPNVVDDCGSGIFAYGASKIILTPNVILGAAGEFIQNPDVLNSEYDQVNIQIEQNTDYNSTQYVYQENGQFFDFTANQGRLTMFINELVKTNNVEELSTDYSEDIVGNPYAEFIQSAADMQQGNFAFRITQAKVNDLLGRANYASLSAANPNSQGLVYRIVATEYVYNGTASIVSEGNQQPGGPFVVTVNDLTGLTIGTIIRLENHATTPPNASQDGEITAINTTNKTVSIDFGDTFGDITDVANGTTGRILIQNNFVVVKGKIN